MATELGFALTGVFAALASGVFLLVRLDKPSKLLISFVSGVLWVLFGFSAFDVQSSGCCGGSTSHTGLGIFALGLGLVMFMFTVQAWFETGSDVLEEVG